MTRLLTDYRPVNFLYTMSILFDSIINTLTDSVPCCIDNNSTGNAGQRQLYCVGILHKTSYLNISIRIFCFLLYRYKQFNKFRSKFLLRFDCFVAMQLSSSQYFYPSALCFMYAFIYLSLKCDVDTKASCILLLTFALN